MTTLHKAFSSWHGELTLFVVAVAVLTSFAILVAAGALALRLVSDRQERVASDCQARWQPVLLDVLAGAASREALWALVAPRHHLRFLVFLLRHWFVVKGGTRAELEALGRPFLEAAAGLLQSRDPSQRARAIRLHGVFGADEAPEVLRGALDDPSPLVAMTAARALALSGRPGAGEAVLAALDRFATWDVSVVASMLALFDPAVTAPALLAIYEDPARPVPTRVAAAEALRWQNHLEAADVAAHILTAEGGAADAAANTEVLTATLRLLRAVGRPEHVSLVYPFTASPSFVLRIHAISAVASLGCRADSVLMEMAFDDASSWVAIRAAQGLAHLDARDVLADLAGSDHPRATLARQFAGG